MPIVRELQVRYIEKEVHDPRIGEPILTVEGIVRLMSFLRFAVDEEVWGLALDAERKLVGIYQTSKGSKHETMIAPSSLFRTALLAEASGLVIVHNHPSGGVSPSQADITGTEGIVMAGIALHLPLVDHVIIGGKSEYSFAQSGMLRFIEMKALKSLGVQGLPEVKHPDERAREATEAMAKLGKKGDIVVTTPGAMLDQLEAGLIEPPLNEYVELAHTEGA